VAYTLLVGHQTFVLGDKTLTTGDSIPEADHWPHIEAYIGLGEIFCLVADRRDVPPGVDPSSPYVFTSEDDVLAVIDQGEKHYGSFGSALNKAVAVEDGEDAGSAPAPEDTPVTTTRKPRAPRKATAKKAPAKKATKKKV